MARETVVVFDTTAISNFAAIDEIDYLTERFNYPVVSSEVAREIFRGQEEGHTYLEKAAGVFAGPTNEILEMDFSPEDTRLHVVYAPEIGFNIPGIGLSSDLYDLLDDGEADALTLCTAMDANHPKYDSMFVTDDPRIFI